AFAVRSYAFVKYIIWNPVKTAYVLFSTNHQRQLLSKQHQKKQRPPISEHLSWEERLADVVTPLWRLNYDKQLEVKQKRQETILSQLYGHLNGDLRSSCIKVQPNFPILSILPSPVQNGYRNKSTFSVNKGVDGNPKTVGFYVGTARSNNIVCVNGDHLLNMPEKHKLVARCYQNFLRLSPLEPCLLFHTGGHWREITIRTNAWGHTMAIVYFHPQTLCPDEVNEHKAALVDYFTTGLGSVCQLDSLFFQESTMTRCSHEESPYQLLHGVPYIYEEILGFKFRISPDAFFQVNQAAAEVLYRTVRDLCTPTYHNATQTTQGGGTLLDVCCGTGAIGIITSPRVNQILGIELVEQAVQDARHNADLNNVHNCEFKSGKAEVVLPGLMKELSSIQSGLTAVVNPARAGLHYRVVRALRNHSAIRRLVYVSCKPEGEAMRNFRELCCAPDSQKKLSGEAFTPTLAVPVDMFPHTPHCELVLLFER
uniref:tRNA (uracil(54)-C(5))-methyltransferase n=1 Tax=Periophthalmus magnuspinnatus TaxID=409849 RepID=A0A3B4AIS8_9GOBI